MAGDPACVGQSKLLHSLYTRGRHHMVSGIKDITQILAPIQVYELLQQKYIYKGPRTYIYIYIWTL